MKENNQLSFAEKYKEMTDPWEERGVKIGILQGKEEVASALLKAGLSIEFITRVTHLDIETIERLEGN